MGWADVTACEVSGLEWHGFRRLWCTVVSDTPPSREMLYVQFRRLATTLYGPVHREDSFFTSPPFTASCRSQTRSPGSYTCSTMRTSCLSLFLSSCATLAVCSCLSVRVRVRCRPVRYCSVSLGTFAADLLSPPSATSLYRSAAGSGAGRPNTLSYGDKPVAALMLALKASTAALRYRGHWRCSSPVSLATESTRKRWLRSQ